MRQKLIFLLMLLCSVYASAYDLIETGPQRTLTKEDALEVAQAQFKNMDVDYFILNDDTKTSWEVFVDAEPMKGWEHTCYVLRFSKTTTVVHNEDVMVIKDQLTLPPYGNYEPLLVKNRYGLKSSLKPFVKKSEQANNPGEGAQRTYAIIISGGVSKLYNYERYWNDCSFIYQTLVNKYGIPKSQVYPIMSDGVNPAADVRTATGDFVSQKLDLDNDGVNDIKLAATKANIRNTLSSLVNKMNKDDHLFIYVIDHGGSVDNNTSSYICLWNNESLYDHELANMVEPFCNKFVNVNVVLGQCFAGGFNDNLTKVGCVVASACTGSESSWSCRDIPFDEFVYQWTCAVNEADHNNTALLGADADNNGRVTMEEAFNYAKSHDRMYQEHPKYVSTPLSVGEDLAFNHLAPAIDIYVKDNLEDTGKEPNITTDDYWCSPSIWVRHEEDGIYEHQNPEFSKTQNMNYIYVRVYNRGKENYSGGKYLHLYWAKASTYISTKGWKGRETNVSGYLTGNHLEPQPIGEIKAGEFKDLLVLWSKPKVAEYNDGDFHYCLLAKIMDTPYDDGYVEGKIYFDVTNLNDQAQKNVTLIFNTELDKAFYVYVRNGSSLAQSYDLELIPQKASDREYFKKAHVEMTLSPKIYAAWERGGSESNDIVPMSTTPNTPGYRTMMLTSPDSRLLSVNLQGDEFDVVKMKFKFDKPTTYGEKYTFNLVQKDKTGKILGGETFVVEAPKLTAVLDSSLIKKNHIGLNKYELGLENSDYKTVRWLDNEDRELGCGESVVVMPTLNNSDYKVMATNENGELAFGTVSLSPYYGIKSVSIDAFSDKILVALNNETPENSTIEINSVLDGTTKLTEKLNPGCSELIIDSNNLERGVYAVIYRINDEVIDSKKVTVQ